MNCELRTIAPYIRQDQVVHSQENRTRPYRKAWVEDSSYIRVQLTRKTGICTGVRECWTRATGENKTRAFLPQYKTLPYTNTLKRKTGPSRSWTGDCRTYSLTWIEIITCGNRIMPVMPHEHQKYSVRYLSDASYENRGRILGRNPDKSLTEFSSFLFTVTSTTLSWDVYFFKLRQSLTISVKEKGGKLDRKPYPSPKL